MNLNELRRRRNKAVKSRNNSYTTAHRAYKNQMMAKAVHGHNRAVTARARVEKIRKNNNVSFMNLRKKAQKLGINLRVKTFYGVRNKTIKELQNNIARRT